MRRSVEYRIAGDCPLILHNGQLSDPSNRFAKLMKAVSGKRSKTEADHEEMARIEWHGSLYIDAEHRVCVPGLCLEAMLGDAARKQRKGQQAKAGLYVPDAFPLVYEGPQDIDDLWDDERFRFTVGVRVQRSRVMRTRPIFPDWHLTFVVDYDDTILNLADVTAFVKYAGANVGLCEWRPRYGRFSLIE